LGNQLRTSYQNDYHKDTRYNTAINNDIVTAVIFRNFSPVLNTQFSLSYSQEKGNSSNSLNEYRISYLTFNPSLTWFFKNKYRISSIFLAQFNNRKGSSAISYLPEKRNGSVYTWSLQSQYRLNSFTSGSLEYSAKSYPNETILHELKMEFRAEL